MEKIATTEISWPKKMKGRPSKNVICTPSKAINYDSTPPANKRSVRHNPSGFNSPLSPEFGDEDEDERKEKKVKLIDRLSQTEEKIKFNSRHQNKRNSRNFDSNSDSKFDDPIVYTRRKNIAVVHRSENFFSAQEDKNVKETETHQNGSQLEFGRTTPLPEEKILVLILEKLKEEDTYGAFSQPVDDYEIPGYYDEIREPMDYLTMENKLINRLYKNLEEFEADVYLICSNAMSFNGKDTVYYQQASAMQEIAKIEFANLKQKDDNNEPQPRVDQRGRPPINKKKKMSVEIPSVARVVPKLISGAYLANGEENTITGYNLRREPTWNNYLDRFLPPPRTRNVENYSKGLTSWNDNFPEHILRADMKHGKKHITVDENRRDTYKQYQPPSSREDSNLLSDSVIDQKQLISVGGIQDPLAYARSLARFAKDLGPVAWKVASRKIEATSSASVPYGPCTPSNNTVSSPSTLNPSYVVAAYGPYKGMLEAVGKFNSQNEITAGGDVSSWRYQFPVQQRNGYQTQRNVSFVEMVRDASKLPENWNPSAIGSHEVAGPWNFGQSSWQALAMQHRNSCLVQPDPNVRVSTGSPSQQPDLALQL